MKVIDVATFGAVGDQITDDRAAIQAAVDAMRSGDTLTGTPGRTYRLSAPIEIRQAHLTFRDLCFEEDFDA